MSCLVPISSETANQEGSHESEDETESGQARHQPQPEPGEGPRPLGEHRRRGRRQAAELQSEAQTAGPGGPLGTQEAGPARSMRVSPRRFRCELARAGRERHGAATTASPAGRREPKKSARACSVRPDVAFQAQSTRPKSRPVATPTETPTEETDMKVKTNLKAGRLAANHNRSLAKVRRR
jgi:hypothetical protein